MKTEAIDLLRRIVAFDSDKEREAMDAYDHVPQCVSCGTSYHVTYTGDDLTPTCHDCAHELLLALARNALSVLGEKTKRRDNRNDARRHPTTLCSTCQNPQYNSPSGITCANGHGGAPAYEPPPFDEEPLL